MLCKSRVLINTSLHWKINPNNWRMVRNENKEKTNMGIVDKMLHNFGMVLLYKFDHLF